jgi:hypothetical protein
LEVLVDTYKAERVGEEFERVDWFAEAFERVDRAGKFSNTESVVKSASLDATSQSNSWSFREA